MENMIIIPCYNEAERLPVIDYQYFLQNNNTCIIVFANDGSDDGTFEVLSELENLFPTKVKIFNLPENVGKAEAVRRATLHIVSEKIEFQKIGYLDADLATSLEEWVLISQQISDKVLFAFGSRIAKIDNYIRRKNYRHYSGRVIATFISNILKLTVYDTQCGCKIFRRDAAEIAFRDPFISKWLFDVEIFFRLKNKFGEENMPQICREVPLHSWRDVAESKVKFTYFFKLWFDLFLIHEKYKNAEKSKP